MERITGVVRDYDWGDKTAIAGILGHEPPGQPEAEYWLGAHPSAPSTLIDRGRTLDLEIADGRASVIGDETWDRFRQLPFLLKILAAEKPLSIQAHPSLPQAKAGFAREEAAGIDRAAPHRNYRDENHKPELICALTRFEAKCGFRPLAETDALLALFSDQVIIDLRHRLESPGRGPGSPGGPLASIVQSLLTLEPDDAARLVGSVATTAASFLADPGQAVDRFTSELEWTVRINQLFPGDIGVVVALLLNHVVLEPGQAMFLEAGNIHSYLHGVGIEVMANSDNVLRGGLTSKHIDVAELLDVVGYDPAPAPVQSPVEAVHRYESPVPEFNLTRLAAFGTASFLATGPEIILVTSGEVELKTSSQCLQLGRGEAVFVGPADGGYELMDRAPGSTLAWRVATG